MALLKRCDVIGCNQEIQLGEVYHPIIFADGRMMDVCSNHPEIRIVLDAPEQWSSQDKAPAVIKDYP